MNTVASIAVAPMNTAASIAVAPSFECIQELTPTMLSNFHWNHCTCDV